MKNQDVVLSSILHNLVRKRKLIHGQNSCNTTPYYGILLNKEEH